MISHYFVCFTQKQDLATMLHLVDFDNYITTSTICFISASILVFKEVEADPNKMSIGPKITVSHSNTSLKNSDFRSKIFFS